ncbi:Gp49 family protein [Escherichia coli]
MNDQQIEKEIQDKGLTAPRITPQHIQSLISGEYYFTAEDGVQQAMHKQDELTKLVGPHREIEFLTFCVLVLKNGFTVTGESACASPENFDAEIGRKIARQNAVNKIWMLEGYLLKQKLSEQ